MIQKATAFAIVRAYHEIEAGENLLSQMEKPLKEYEQPDLRDCFGRRRGLSLGIPMADSGERLLDVAPKLAVVVIRAHIAEKRAELQVLNLQAWREAEGEGVAEEPSPVEVP